MLAWTQIFKCFKKHSKVQPSVTPRGAGLVPRAGVTRKESDGSAERRHSLCLRLKTFKYKLALCSRSLSSVCKY